MHCSRCQGLLLKDHLLDMEGGFGEMWAQSWRCVNCGAVHDGVIQHNQLARQANVLVLTNGEPHTQEHDIYLGAEAFIRPAA
jgi:uncharacterized Zn finger protein